MTETGPMNGMHTNESLNGRLNHIAQIISFALSTLTGFDPHDSSAHVRAWTSWLQAAGGILPV